FPARPPARPSTSLPQASGTALVRGRSGWGAEHSSGHPGVVALAEQVVRCEDSRFSDLPARLLSRTLIVRDLTAARAIASLDAGFRCIALQGELLDEDGTLTVGMHHAEAGILSRKSELRELLEQAGRLDLRLTEFDRDLIDLRDRIGLLDTRSHQAQEEI